MADTYRPASTVKRRGQGGSQARAASGFLPTRPRLHRAYNLIVSAVLLALAAPLILALSAALFVTQGRQVFYRGERIGGGGRTFRIVKFRTLDHARARELTRSSVLPIGTNIETPLGRFLRETRLDELPQLFNVVLGDMNLCGPRPVRAEIAEDLRKTIPNYDARFAVKPGLIGHAQAYMSHGTSKAIRARYNNLLVRAPVSYLHEIGMVGTVGACVLARTWSELELEIRRRLSGGRLDLDANRAAALDVWFAADDGREWHVASAGDRRLTLEGALPDPTRTQGRLVMTLPDGRRRAARIEIDFERPAPAGGRLCRYAALTDYADHILSRYLMMRVVVPHKSYMIDARLRRAVNRAMGLVNRRVRARAQAREAAREARMRRIFQAAHGGQSPTESLRRGAAA